MADRAVFGAIDQVGTGLNPHVGLDQQCFQVVPKLVGDRVIEGEQASDLAEEAAAGLLGRPVDLLFFLLRLLFGARCVGRFAE